MSERYPKQLERMMRLAISRAKALIPTAAESSLWGLEWIWAACGSTDRPLFSLNCFCLKQGVNAVCFTRSTILLFDRNRLRAQISHNLGSAAAAEGFIDSW